MMYQSKLVAYLKCNGKVVREFQDTCYIPYGQEYSVCIKNLNSVRAMVDIAIDGRAVFENGSLVVNANSEVEVERFVSNNSKGNRFKFIERTGRIEEHRGVGAEDGLIRIAFKFEKIYCKPIVPQTVYRGGISGSGVDAFYGNVSKGMLPRAESFSSSVLRSSASEPRVTASAQVNEVGITVEGSQSNQQFQTVGRFPLEIQEHVIVLRLLGEVGQNVRVEQPVIVTKSTLCRTCGIKNKSRAKFCSECGTAVGAELVA